MSNSHVPVYWLPIVISLWVPTSFLITYSIAVSKGHVYPWLPSISSTGTLPPESCWFGLFVNISTFLVLFVGYIRHAQVREFSVCRPKTGPSQWTNLMATTVGFVSSAGLFIVANWQVTNALRIHYIGAQCCFYTANVYFIFQAVFSFWMAPEMNSLLVFVLRALLSLLMLTLNIGCYVCEYMAIKLFTGKSEKDMLQWDPSEPGWAWHIAYTIQEWSLVLVLVLCVLTFYPDFRKIRLEQPTLKMKRMWISEIN